MAGEWAELLVEAHSLLVYRCKCCCLPLCSWATYVVCCPITPLYSVPAFDHENAHLYPALSTSPSCCLLRLFQVRFLSCAVYTVSAMRGRTQVLVEEELDGRFTKW